MKIPSKTPEEHKYTSTGIKFWRHPEQMNNYKNGNPNTVISTHISPEGACNLTCAYCSVTYRDTHSRIEMGVIKDYITKLKTRGLKAAILTGGGEPTSYKHINELIRWLKAQDLSVALITNGTLTRRINPDIWNMLEWVRVSINVFPGWDLKINLPTEHFTGKTIVGSSFCYDEDYDLDTMRRVSIIATRIGAQYIRLLPNCLLPQEELLKRHELVEKLIKELDDPRYFHQFKIHGAPASEICHQSYFRPYLSEEIHWETGEPGSVFPCDSVVLNDQNTKFMQKYSLCAPGDILDYMDKKIPQRFSIAEQCTGCVFTENVNMLKGFIEDKVSRFDEFNSPLMHEEFV